MSILTRLVRLCKADIHGVMDQLEDNELLLKQCLRDMEEEIYRKEGKLKKVATSRDRVLGDHEKYSRESEKLEQDVASAIEKDKDDIARLLIRKLKPLVSHRDELGRHIETLDREIGQLQDCVKEHRLQHERLQLSSTKYFHNTHREQWEKALSATVGHCVFLESTDEEVELELLQRKEAAKGGAIK